MIINDSIYERIFSDSPSGIYAVSNENRIILWNTEMERLTGMSADEIIGQDAGIIKFFLNKTYLSELDYNRCLDEDKDLKNIVFLINKKNVFKQVYIRANNLKDDSSGIKVIFTINDFSEIIGCRIKNESRENNTFYGIVGKNKKMKEIYHMIELASESMSNVLIMGESGTGKELIAKAIHNLSARKNEPFIVVNCSALSESLLETELFGHLKGSFTGAYNDKIGKFEAANNGTIFLDEIGDITPLMQVKLLRVIQEKSIVRVGDNREIKVNIRIIAATNKDLRQMVRSAEFREDLFYRLNVFPILTVPLRARSNDIPLLCNHFLEKYNQVTGKNIEGFTPDSLRLLLDYCWPGNVRELENSIEHAFVVCNKELIEVFDLPQELRVVSIRQGICNENNINKEDTGNNINSTNVNIVNKKLTKDDLITLLNKNNWNKTKTADEIGISRVALWKKLKKLGIE